VKEPAFLGLDEVLALHADQIDRYGGTHGLRDLGLLESALAAPRATFGGGFLHGTLPEMAAAYLYHLVRNHPFLDGNKRTGLAATIAFLGLNGLWLEADPDSLVALVVGVAEGRVGKAEVAVYLKESVTPF
jgi:death-on-curing protein